jgi:hypothetical protein
MRSRLVSHARIALALVPAVLPAATLAGCASSASSGNGVASKTPARIVALAKAAAAGAASVHVAGSIVSQGKPISLNMELLARQGGKGRIALDGLSFRLIDVDRAVYVKGSTAFYSRFAGSTAARVLRGKWLKGSAKTGALASLASLADLRKLLDGTLAGHGALSRGASASIDGQKAVGVTDAAGDGTLYVAATGTPYPLEIVKAGPSGGRIVFDRWNQPVSLAVPTNAINVEQLETGR